MTVSSPAVHPTRHPTLVSLVPAGAGRVCLDPACSKAGLDRENPTSLWKVLFSLRKNGIWTLWHFLLEPCLLAFSILWGYSGIAGLARFACLVLLAGGERPLGRRRKKVTVERDYIAIDAPYKRTFISYSNWTFQVIFSLGRMEFYNV